MPRPNPGPGGRPDTKKLSKRKRFDLQSGQHLDRHQAPNVGKQVFKIVANLEETGDGVIVAQGGVTWGYSLYVTQGHVAFAVRQAGKLTTIVAESKLPAAPCGILARVEHGGTVELCVDGNPVAAGQIGGPIGKMPADGCDVGADNGDPVGDYGSANTFQGRIGKVTIFVGAQQEK